MLGFFQPTLDLAHVWAPNKLLNTTHDSPAGNILRLHLLFMYCLNQCEFVIQVAGSWAGLCLCPPSHCSSGSYFWTFHLFLSSIWWIGWANLELFLFDEGYHPKMVSSSKWVCQNKHRYRWWFSWIITFGWLDLHSMTVRDDCGLLIAAGAESNILGLCHCNMWVFPSSMNL